MATNRKAKAMCDTCGFVYAQRVMRLSSYHTLQCPTCFDRQYDLKNHPQNRVPDTRDDPTIANPRPDDGGRNIEWQTANITWDDSSDPNTRKWETV
jgi:hypothetical protein|tara:strand:+ start:199 stop:486 length:288 start_codon:yes stop_codon:yes gene_type:complete